MRFASSGRLGDADRLPGGQAPALGPALVFLARHDIDHWWPPLVNVSTEASPQLTSSIPVRIARAPKSVRTMSQVIDVDVFAFKLLPAPAAKHKVIEIAPYCVDVGAVGRVAVGAASLPAPQFLCRRVVILVVANHGGVIAFGDHRFLQMGVLPVGRNDGNLG